MIITGGIHRGRKIKTIQSHDVRPTSSKVRESIFNIIQSSIANSVMLDLFAGSGIMGFEAISRGAKKLISVEKSPKVIKILKENLSNFDFESELIYSDAIQALDKLKCTFDIIFIDPPYATNLIKLSLAKIKDNDLLNENGIIVCEHSSTFDMGEKFDNEYFKILKEKKYGDTAITIITK